MRYSAFIALGAAMTWAGAAAAQDSRTFIEVGGGAATTHAGSFEFINPNGGQYIATFPNPPFDASKVVGNDIILDHQRRDASSITADVTVGRFVTNTVFLRATYRHLGRYHFSGSATFPLEAFTPLAYDQDYYLRGNGFYAGVGYEKRFGPMVFMDVSAEAGVARLHSVSQQGANLQDPLGHPPRTVSKLSGGAVLAMGVHLNRRLDLLTSIRGDWLGSAETGVSQAEVSADGNFGLNADEQLKLHKLSSFGVGIGLRARF